MYLSIISLDLRVRGFRAYSVSPALSTHSKPPHLSISSLGLELTNSTLPIRHQPHAYNVQLDRNDIKYQATLDFPINIDAKV